MGYDAGVSPRARFFQVCDETTLAGLGALHRRVVDEIIVAVGDARGGEAARRLREMGIGRLHQVIDASDFGPLRDHVLETLRGDLLRLAVQVGRGVMGWEQDFYVDDYLILRINFPHEVARLASTSIENPGIGRVSPSVRDLAASRRVKDPVYDPSGYHNGYPPAAWAHGPHIDSWAGHSRDGLNIWWAISDVPAEAGMVFYPELDAETLVCDRRTLYLRARQPLPPPTLAPLAAGQALIFDPETLHGTHLNVTDQTRVAVSLRLNASKPTFDPATFYAREFWRAASAIEAGQMSAPEHLKREDNLSSPHAPDARVAPPAPAIETIVLDDAGPSNEGGSPVAPASALALGERLVVRRGDLRVMVLRHEAGLSAIDARCPHYGVDLADGGFAGGGADDPGRLHCPACAVAFDLQTGRSACASLTLTLFEARDENQMIIVDFTPKAVV